MTDELFGIPWDLLYWALTVLTAVLAVVIAVWGLHYVRNYNGTSPRSVRFLVIFGTTLVVLGIIGGVAQLVFLIMGTYDGPQEELLAYKVYTLMAYLVGYLIWWMVFLSVVGKRRAALKRALYQRF